MNSTFHPGGFLVLAGIIVLVGAAMWRVRTMPTRLGARENDVEPVIAPPAEISLSTLDARIAALEAASEERFSRMRSWVFWVPMLWALIGAVCWMIAIALSR